MQCERRDAFNDLTWAEYFTQPRIPEGPLDDWGQSCQSPNKDLGARASESLKFLGCGDAPKVGVTGDARNGKSIHGHLDDGNQRCLSRRNQEDDEVAGKSELHS